MNDYIKLKKRDTFKMGIKDEDGNPKLDENGQEMFIEFDLEDLEIPERYSNCVEQCKKASATLRDETLIINKKQDVKSKDGIMSRNEKAKYSALKKFYKSTEEAIDLFLGDGGTQKIFGDLRYLEMWDDLSEMLEPILPQLNMNVENIDKRIKEKYKVKNEAVLKNE